MRKLASFLLFALPAFGAVSGTVVNQTTGKPQANTPVTLYTFGQGGMQPFNTLKTDAQGAFNFPNDPQAPGPKMVRVEIDGVTYNKLMTPGTPTTGITLDVYDASRQPGAAKVSKHMLLFEPAGSQMTVNETFLIENKGKTTWADPAGGTIHFFMPEGAANLDAKGTAPDGLPVPIPTDKSGKPNVYAAKFEIKPGETRLDLTYTVPYKTGDTYDGKIESKDDNSYLIAPNGITLRGKSALSDLGTEPRTQAHIYGLTGTTYKIVLTGAEAAAPADTSANNGADGAADQSDSGPQIEQIMPRVYDRKYLILGVALGILGLGFVLLYRQSETSKETHERGSR